MRTVLRSLGVLVLLGLAAPPAARALDIPYQFDPNRHNRFLSGFSNNPVQNPNVLGMPGLDFSGVGWGSAAYKSINVAMVTARHFIVAEHNRPAVDTQVNFLGTDGVVRSYTVEKYIPLRYDPGNPNNVSDLMVGQLTAAIQSSDNITIYPVVRPGPFQYPLSNTPPEVLNYYRGKEIVVVGKNDTASQTGGPDADGDGYDDRGPKIAKNVIDDLFVYNFGSVDSNTVGAGFYTPANTPDAGKFVSGDSGSPSFLLYEGMLTALGAHSAAGTVGGLPYNVDGFLPYYVDQINSLISATGFQIRILNPVPEPGPLALIGAAGAGVFVVRRRRRRQEVSA